MPRESDTTRSTSAERALYPRESDTVSDITGPTEVDQTTRRRGWWDRWEVGFWGGVALTVAMYSWR